MTQHEKLTAALKTQSQAATPAYSELLHQRIMARLRQEARSSGAAPMPGTSPLKFGWQLSVAAAILVVIGSAAWMLSHAPTASTNHPDLGVIHQVPSLPNADHLLPPAVSGVRTSMEESKYAYLDRDAKRFAGFLLSQLPGKKE